MSERFWKIRETATGLYHTNNFTGPKRGGKCYSTVGSARNAWNALRVWVHLRPSKEYELVEFEAHEVRTETLK